MCIILHILQKFAPVLRDATTPHGLWTFIPATPHPVLPIPPSTLALPVATLLRSSLATRYAVFQLLNSVLDFELWCWIGVYATFLSLLGQNTAAKYGAVVPVSARSAVPVASSWGERSFVG